MKLNSIQFLRGVAALLVVYEHSMTVQIKYSVSKEQNFFHLNHFGCIGVDLFFVISGFIITFVAHKYNGPSQGLHFIAKRFCRINPVYYIATLFSLVAYFLGLKITHKSVQPLLKDIGLHVSDSILIFPTSDIVESFSPLLVVGWTLAFEWLFYILFFSLIFFNVKRKALFFMNIVGCLAFIGSVSHFDDLRLIFLTNPIMLEFLLGVIICYSYLYIKRIPALIGSILLIMGIIGYLLLIVFGFGQIWHYQLVLSGDQSLNRFLYWGIPSSFIVAGSVILEKEGKLNSLWSNKASTLAGDASYSIYLIHLTVLNLLMLLYLKTGFLMQPDLMLWFQIIIVVAISIVYYKLIENPLLLYMNRSNIWNFLFGKKSKVSKTSKASIEPANA
jgi:exopolysaccharide production protein ExoZ